MQWMMLQQEHPNDFVIATGRQSSVREFVDLAAASLEMNLYWEGTGVDAKAFDDQGRVVVAVDPDYFRPTEVETLLGDATKARRLLGWSPKTDLYDLVSEMTRHDLDAAERDALMQRNGYQVHQPCEI